jgi:hypothetical protein
MGARDEDHEQANTPHAQLGRGGASNRCPGAHVEAFD